jgi:phosphoheptose isomerase
MINGFDNFPSKFASILKTNEWKHLQENFNSSARVLLVGNGGNLAVCDHGAIDIARLTNKSSAAPGSGILASSLINDATHDLWVKNWLEICLRGLDKKSVQSTLLIGVSSSGYSKNICMALEHAHNVGCQAALISAAKPKIKGKYNTIVLNVDEYHTSEVLTLALIYELIHTAGFTCPSISAGTTQKVMDYSSR